MNDNGVDMASVLSAQDVEAFLLENPDFFQHRDDLLSQLVIPHRRGDTISLVERQLSLLRASNDAKTQDVETLLHNARDNDSQFASMQRLVLALMEAKTLDIAIDAVDDSLIHDFGVTAFALTLVDTLFAGRTRVPCHTVDKICRCSGVADLFGKRQILCCHTSADQRQFFFPESVQTINTTTLLPLYFHGPLGVLAIGAPEKNATVIGRAYLMLIGEVLSRTLSRLA